MIKKRKKHLQKLKVQKERKQLHECFDEPSEKQEYDLKGYERRRAIPPIFDFGVEPLGIYYKGMDLSAIPCEPSYPIGMLFQIGGIPVSLQRQIIDRCCFSSENKKYIDSICLVGQDSYVIRVKIAIPQDKIGTVKLYFPDFWDKVSTDIFGEDSQYLNAQLGYWCADAQYPDGSQRRYESKNLGERIYSAPDCECLDISDIVNKYFAVKPISRLFPKTP